MDRRQRPAPKPDAALALAWVRAVTASGRAREIRNRAGLSQAEMATSVGVGRTTVALWEEARRAPRGDAALRYAGLLRSLERLAESQGVGA